MTRSRWLFPNPVASSVVASNIANVQWFSTGLSLDTSKVTPNYQFYCHFRLFLYLGRTPMLIMLIKSKGLRNTALGRVIKVDNKT